jgi:hypothetical protein
MRFLLVLLSLSLALVTAAPMDQSPPGRAMISIPDRPPTLQKKPNAHSKIPAHGRKHDRVFRELFPPKPDASATSDKQKEKKHKHTH